MKHIFLLSLFVTVFVLTQYYRPTTVMAQALKEPCNCEQDAGAVLGLGPAESTLENIVRQVFSERQVGACITERFAGGELTVRVQGTDNDELISTVEKTFDGSLACVIENQDTIGEPDNYFRIPSSPLSRSAFNSCKTSIRTLCDDIVDLLSEPI